MVDRQLYKFRIASPVKIKTPQFQNAVIIFPKNIGGRVERGIPIHTVSKREAIVDGVIVQYIVHVQGHRNTAAVVILQEMIVSDAIVVVAGLLRREHLHHHCGVVQVIIEITTLTAEITAAVHLHIDSTALIKNEGILPIAVVTAADHHG